MTIIQFRCPVCLKLLFKLDPRTFNIEYRVSKFSFEQDDQGRTKYIDCPKCKTPLEIMKDGMVKQDRVNSGKAPLAPSLK
jgi:hypothetical protein